VIAVRVLRQGAVVREQVFRDLPVRVGRAPDSDVVLFDPSVSRAHAVIETDAAGEIVIRDAGSRNAVHLGPRAVSEAHGAGVVRCLLGRTEIEVERLPAGDTLELRPEDRALFEQRRTIADHVRYVALGVVAWLALVVGDSDFWSPWQQNRAGTLLGHTLGAAVTLPLAAFVLLGVLRLAGRRMRIADTLRALALVAWAYALATVVLALLYYALPAGAHGQVAALAGTALMVWSVVFLASLRRPGPGRLFRIAWGVAALALVAGMQTVGSLAQRRMGMPQVDHELQPPLGPLAGPNRPMGTYLDALGTASEAAARNAADVHARHASSRAARARASN
jgi:hypothetical protein